jgi:hypothetical protein
MANVQIPNLPAAIALNGEEQIPAVQNGTTVRISTSLLGIGSSVTQIIAGENITISPSNGLGQVTINAAGGGGTPGGTNGQWQWNNSGSFAGIGGINSDSSFTLGGSDNLISPTGSILTFTVTSYGSGWPGDSAFDNFLATGGSGLGASFTVINSNLSSGPATSVTLGDTGAGFNGGAGYKVGDVINIDLTQYGGGSGIVLNVTSISSSTVVLNSFSAVLSGNQNLISNQFSFIGGGFQNVIIAESSSQIIGYDFIGAGSKNKIDDGISGGINVIVGGTNNLINGYESYGAGHFIGGGAANLIDIRNGSGLFNIIAGGLSNKIQGQSGNINFSSILGGYFNSINNTYGFIGGGNSNTVNSEGGIANGQNAIAYIPDGVALPTGTSVQEVLGAPNLFLDGSYSAINGGSQTGRIVISRIVRAGSEPVAILVPIQSQTVNYSEATIVASSSIIGAEFAVFKRAAVIDYSVLGISNITLNTDIGSNAGSPPSGWSAQFNANSGSTEFQIVLTGDASYDTNWTISIITTEVSQSLT